jgi:hypothetical protein
MSIIKIAVAPINPKDIKHDALDHDDPEIMQYFKKTAADLKAIAPKANDFLYFTCIMMHAAEAALLDDAGSLRKTADGKDAEASWDIDKNGSWIWKSNDSRILPYKNLNSDVFPRSELKKAYKKWVGKPLCLDHQSQSVDMIRGVIVDTVYDDKMDRIVALCALDKKNYPDLAHKVASGVSASVSMGVAVGKAICTEKGCHRVARTESEFCQHMKARSGYGEINIDLSPIELSIVVNGADPKAKIRRVIAAADQMANYVDKQKLDESGITVEDAEVLKDGLESKIQEIESVEGNTEVLNNEGVIEPPYGHGGRSAENAPQTDTPTGNVPQAGNTERFASDVLNRLKEKVSQLDAFINNMASVKMGRNTNNEDTVMANEKKAYFQGGGGVNEPTPGQVKYPKEEADSIRDKEDKQMTGQSDTGPVDGMHPGYESFGESEIERKKRLLRASDEQQARSLRREAAMNKAKEMIRQKREAYFQGGGDVNEPTPGKPKYPKEDSDKIRDKEDKQMTGESPFPGVGKIDGLYGDDEKTKKMLNRAKLSASFIKAASPDGSDDLANCCWNVYAKDDSGKRLVLSAKVKDLAGPGRVNSLYAGIATQEYGRKMIQTIREAGIKAAQEIYSPEEGATFNPAESAGAASPAADKVRDIMNKYVCKKLPNESAFRACSENEAKMFADNNMVAPLGYEFQAKAQASVKKTAQPAPGAVPGQTPDAGMPAAIPTGPVDADPGADPAGDDPGYAGETGSAVDTLKTNVDELGNLQAELQKGLETLEEEKGELVEGPAAPAGAVTASAMRSKLNAALIKGFKQSIAETADVKEELELIKHVVSSGADAGNQELVKELYADAKADIKKVKANVHTMLESFVRYANGNALFAKVAQLQDVDMPLPSEPLKGDDMPADDFDTFLRDLNSETDNLAADDKKKKGKLPWDKDEDEDEEDEKEEKAKAKKEKEKEEEEEKKEKEEEEKEDEDDLKYDSAAKTLEGEPEEIKKAIAGMTRQERDLLRVKLAQKGIQFSDMLGKAHPKGGTTTQLDVKPTGAGAKVEDLEEIHDEAMRVALAVPKATKAAAEKIQMLVTAGEIDPAKDFPALIAEGLDSAAVAYWKKFWGEAKDPEASKFVGDLVKDYQTKKAAVDKQGLQVKIARCYEAAYSMAERGLISRDPRSLRQQSDRLMTYDDGPFEDFVKTINKLPIKQASVSDIASINGMQDSVVTATNAMSSVAAPESLVDSFAQAFNGRKY